MPVEVLKFGSSVLRTAHDLPFAVDEIYRRWRSGCRVLAVVSAFEGVTNRLMTEASDILEPEPNEATAAYVATGEQQTAALLVGTLLRSGIPSRMIEPREIGLTGEGSTLDSTPVRVNTSVLEDLWIVYPILVLPGFYGIDVHGRTALFGRGGSDMSALFLATQLGAACRLLKDVRGVFDTDPACGTRARLFAALSWPTAIAVAGPLIQAKALHYARTRALAFEVARPNDGSGTTVGHTHDAWAAPFGDARPLKIALMGLGVVGRGVYKWASLYPQRFEIVHVIVREPARYSGVECLTSDHSAAFDDAIDIVIVCIGGLDVAYRSIAAALAAGKFVITADKAAVAAHGRALFGHAHGTARRLWYSAAVGGALPALEALAVSKSPVKEIRGIVNGTCGFVLNELEKGHSLTTAIAKAQAAGFAESDPIRDLSGRDSADKLALLVEAAFGEVSAPESVPTVGIDALPGDSRGYKLIACARRTASGVEATVKPEIISSDSFLGQASGAENRLEITLTNGEVIYLRGQGAGRWPTAVSVIGDLHEVGRAVEALGPA